MSKETLGRRKRDVLRRFAGNRYVMVESGLGVQPTGEPFVALNEAFVVFAGDSEVIEALETMHAELGRPNRLIDNILTLVKEMAAAADVPIGLNDSFIERPFVPTTRWAHITADYKALAKVLSGR